MTNRIERKLASLKAQNKAGLVSFVMAGDPDLDVSKQIIETLIDSGSSIVEIGMPFSDPVADGPVIQNSAIRALEHKINLHDCLSLVSDIRVKNDDTPLILMGYFNPILKYGVEKFLADASSAGVDGFIIVDLPLEESGRYLADFRKHNLSLIQLLTPNTPTDRIKEITDIASGFVYYVSVNAITGTKIPVITQIKEKVEEIKVISPVKLAVGFGINTKEQADALGEFAELIVIGSRYIRCVEEGGGADVICKKIRSFNQEILSSRNL